MSKNFQLLMRAEQEVSSGSGKKRHQVLWTPPAEVHAVPSCPLDGVDERSRDQVAKLVRQLFLLPGAVRAVAFAAVEPGNGCSWMAVQCARILASQVGGAVCIIDANLHSPSLHRSFGIGNYRGFSDVMSHPGRLRDCVFPVSGVSNLWLMTAGSSCDGRDAFGGERLQSVIEELRSHFDYLIIDSAALNPYGDALMLGQAADGIALVVAEQNTRKESARHAVEELKKANVRILGAVLNKRTFPIPQKLYEKL